MTRLSRLHAGLVDGMALVAGLTLVWLMVAIVAAVGLRSAGLQAPAWMFVSTEYGMLYLTMLGAPWLARRKGHVYVELLTAALPEGARNALSRLVALFCVVVCAILAWKGVELVATNLDRRDFDVRAYFFPKWLLTIAFPVSFGLMAVEFARFVVGPDLLHSGEAGVRE